MDIDDCADFLHPSAKAGLRLMNQGRYFEAHEELEVAWRAEKGKVRELYQGILQAAVTYLHITRGNYPGALKLCGRSMRWLREWPETCRGLDVGQLRRDLQAAAAAVEKLGPDRLGEFDQNLLKPVIWRDGS
jgi:predicted metal-dependent hydrolase